VTAKGRAPVEDATVVVEEKAAVAVTPEVVVAPPRGLRRYEGRRGGDVGRAHGGGCGVGRGGGTEQQCAGNGARANGACCHASGGRQ
jgi:hypothetical protein